MNKNYRVHKVFKIKTHKKYKHFILLMRFHVSLRMYTCIKLLAIKLSYKYLEKKYIKKFNMHIKSLIQTEVMTKLPGIGKDIVNKISQLT